MGCTEHGLFQNNLTALFQHGSTSWRECHTFWGGIKEGMAKWRKLERINANLQESTSEASPSQILESANRVAVAWLAHP